MSHPQRLLFIGLDALDADLIDTWSQAGKLPTFRRLQEQGVRLQPGGSADNLHASAWTTLFTGVPPDEHGHAHAYVSEPGQQTSKRPKVDELSPPPFWRYLDSAGIRCISADPFMSGPLDAFAGIQIVDWGTWTRFRSTAISPPQVEAKIRARFGRHRAPDHSKVGMEPLRDPEAFAKGLLAGIEQRSEMYRWLLEHEAWDFAMLMFSEAHAAGHYLWHYQDPKSPAYPGQSVSSQLTTALEGIYVAMDKALAKLLSVVDEHTSVWLCSCDGLRANHSASHLLPALLDAAGLSGREIESTKSIQASKPSKPSKPSPLRRLRQLVPSSARAYVSRNLLPRRINERLAMHWQNEGKDWSKIRVSVVENANEGFLRVNLAGREPEGIVQPGREYDELCSQLVQWLSGLVHPETKAPIAKRVLRADQHFSGTRKGVIADVIAVWNYDAEVGDCVESPHFGILRAKGSAHELPPYYSGNHEPKPYFLATGPNQPTARPEHAEDLLDLAPSVLDHFGVACPPHMKGRNLGPS